ncbi:MAG: TIM barrel protein [Alphaproteobacteria bacterium]|nr:TIM barrel protein [Alphaproteobacteria bacterium]
MTKFSANLGFLWTELELPKAILAAHDAGFEAVECHFPYDVPEEDVCKALEATGLPMVGLNTVRGDTEAGEFGLAALPGAEERARAAIDQAIAYAAATGTFNVHVMAGQSASRDGAHEVFVENLRYAADRAAAAGVGILIEPINRRDVPEYFLSNVDQAAKIIEEIGVPNLKMMFDCYHIQIMQGDLTKRLEAHLPLIAHVQIAGVPGRNEPDTGEVAYPWLLGALDDLGYTGFVGAEYVPLDTTQAGLSWLEAYAVTP